MSKILERMLYLGFLREVEAIFVAGDLELGLGFQASRWCRGDPDFISTTICDVKSTSWNQLRVVGPESRS